MRTWNAQRVAEAAGARLVGAVPEEGPSGVSIDSRAVTPGDLFIALPGSRVDGAEFVDAALAAGAWGVLVGSSSNSSLPADAVALLAEDTLASLASLARAWRRELGARVVAVTGSTGKTTTKDILAALLGTRLRTVATPRNLNTGIGLPLSILAAPVGTELLVLELAMRGRGQIAELAAICEPDVGVIVNIGAAHLESLGSLAEIAAAKAELIAALAPGKTIVIPAEEPLLVPHLRDDVKVLRFGVGGDVTLQRHEGGVVEIACGNETVALEPNFSAAHQLTDLLAAVAAASALAIRVEGRLDVEFSGLRGERVTLPGGVTVIDDCYNANPMSMKAALEELAATASQRRVAVLGDMLELGPREEEFHRALGEQADLAGVDVLITVGERARWCAEEFHGEHHHTESGIAAARVLGALLRTADTVLVKGSRGVGLEVVTRELAAGVPR